MGRFAGGRATLALLPLLGLLAGCAAFQGDQAIECPPVRILQDAAEVRFYRDGPGRDLTDVTLEAKFEGVAGECIYDKGRLDITFIAAATAALGPAGEMHKRPIPYFVAVVDPNQRILRRERFNLPVEFPENFMRVAVRDEVNVRLPLANLAEATDYTVYVGFEVSRDQFELQRGDPRR